MNNLRKIDRVLIQDEVFDQLKDNIVSGVWPPETKLPSEDQLSKMLSVSRITIRSALQKLSALGLIDSQHGKGTFVRTYSLDNYTDSLVNLIALDKKDLGELLEIRKILEIGIAGLAAERVSTEDLQTLESIYDMMRENASDIDAFADYDAEFHLFLADITGNFLIKKIFALISQVYGKAMHRIVRIMGEDDAIHYHGEILEAIRRHDVEATKKYMAEHIDRTITAVGDSDER